VYGNQFVTAINAVARPDIAFRVNSAFIIANIVLNVGLILWIGWVGAAVATAISTTLLLVLGYGALVHLIGPIEIPIREFGMQTMAAGMMAGAIYFITLIAPDGIPATIGLVGLGAAIYSGIVISISSRVREKLRAVIASLIRHSEIPARP
jgi:O-antigen/teichoic acid export membrane protein